MNRLFAALVIALIPAYGSCGADSGESQVSAHVDGPAAMDDEGGAGHFLGVTVDGTRYEALGTLFGPTVTFGAREINVQVGGPLTSAIANGKAVSLGDYDLSMNLLTNSILPGEYPIVYNRNRVVRSEEPMGFVELFFPDSSPLGILRPMSGTLTVESVDGSEDKGRYRLQRASGSISGQFKDEAGAELQVEIEFIYRR